MGLLGAGALVFAAGVLFGLFGAGGSILLVPILVYVLDLPVKSALGTSLLILMLTGFVATLAHARVRNVSWWIGLRWAAVGMVAAYLGGRVAEFIPEQVLLTLFASVVVVVSLAMMRRRPLAPAVDPRSIPMGKVVAVGAALGFLTGVMGVGGGFLLVPALVLLCGIDVKVAVGTSLLIIAVNSLGGFLGFAAHEEFPWRLTLTVAAFNAAGSLVGQRIGRNLPGERLRPAFGVFLLIVGAAMVVESLLRL
ncbi:MAG: sulfite exporter TauE/SafE family protein [Candidatus Latescibacteria bacterium]|nr:sulfite exporter TauE/SafE family protein [Candidatus Latescibacterota bacterium]